MIRQGYTVTRRADGRYMVRVELAKGPNNQRRRPTRYAATEAEADALGVALVSKVEHRKVVGTTAHTLAQFAEVWFKTYKAKWRPATRRQYRRAIDHWINPYLGTIKIEDLNKLIAQQWLNDLAEVHGAIRSVGVAHAALRSCLAEAKRKELVPSNAAEDLIVPAPEDRPVAALDQDAARVFLEHALAHPLAALFTILIACGLRIGEVCGLSWDDYNETTGELTIRRQLQRVEVEGQTRANGKQLGRLDLLPLKTKKSRRTVEVPPIGRALVKTYRTAMLAARLKAGDKWATTGPMIQEFRRRFPMAEPERKPTTPSQGLMFTTYAQRGGQVGTPQDPRNISRVLDRILVAAEIPKAVTLHGLRHSAASLLIADGVPLEQITQLLGHAEMRTTIDLYGHLQKQTAARAAVTMDRILGGVRK